MNKVHKIKDRLLPSIFDRLTDEEPRRQKEGKNSLIMSSTQYKKAVLRDIMNLLNSNSLFTIPEQETVPENILRSTINYGTPALSGILISEIDWSEVETQLENALINFEPRLEKESIKVQIIVNDKTEISQNRLVIAIYGKLVMSVYSNELWLRTAMDVETGSFQMIDGKENE